MDIEKASNKIQHCECLVDRQTLFCAIIESAQFSFLYHDDGLKSLCLKNTAGLSLLGWDPTRELLFLYTVLLNIERCIVEEVAV